MMKILLKYRSSSCRTSLAWGGQQEPRRQVFIAYFRWGCPCDCPNPYGGCHILHARPQQSEMFKESSTDSEDELNAQNLYVPSIFARGNLPAFPISKEPEVEAATEDAEPDVEETFQLRCVCRPSSCATDNPGLPGLCLAEPTGQSRTEPRTASGSVAPDIILLLPLMRSFKSTGTAPRRKQV